MSITIIDKYSYETLTLFLIIAFFVELHQPFVNAITVVTFT